MDLLFAFLIAYLGPPLAAVLFFVAAWKMRTVRPRRAKAVMWPLCTIVICIVVLMAVSGMVPGNPATFEMIALVIGAGLGVIATIAVCTLLVPNPQNGVVVTLIIAGFVCLIAGGALMVEIANTNFGL